MDASTSSAQPAPAGTRLAFTGPLRPDSHGIWASGAVQEVSYPSGAHDRYALIEDGSWWFAHRNRVILDAVRRDPPPGLILDVGGGNGYVTRGLLDAGFQSALLEPGPAGAYNGRVRRNLPEVYRATLEEAGIKPGSLGAAGCFDVLEHVQDAGAMVGRIRSLLMPGGLLYATVPARSWLWSAADAEAGHFRRYSPGSVRRLLQPGFKVLRCIPFFDPLVLPVLLARALPYRLGYRRNPLTAEAEHGSKGGLASRIMSGLLRREAAKLAAGGRCIIGTSLLVVARKREDGHG